MEWTALQAHLRDMGIVGAGGAGFPAYAKLGRHVDTLVLNCAECEPLFQAHQRLLALCAFDILGALEHVAQAIDAQTVVLALKSHQAAAIDAVRAALPSFPRMRLQLLPDRYPMGDEVVLTYETTGRVVPPGGLPIDVSVTVLNVETVYNIARALSISHPVTDTCMSVLGEVATPRTMRIPIGMSVADAVVLAGGVTTDDPVYFLGGVMTGTVVSPEASITKTTNAVFVLPRLHYAAHKRLGNTAIQMRRAQSACCHCQMCTDLCPRHLLGHPIAPHAFMNAVSEGMTQDTRPIVNALYCSACGLCEMYACTQGLSPRTLLAACRAGLQQRGVRPERGQASTTPLPERAYRGVPAQRLIARLGLAVYEKPAPLDNKVQQAQRVVIACKQGVGAPVTPIVQAGDRVKRCDCIGKPPEDALGVNLHAPITGVVLTANAQQIVIAALPVPAKEDA